jgi:hypothetical protein
MPRPVILSSRDELHADHRDHLAEWEGQPPPKAAAATLVSRDHLEAMPSIATT